MNANERLAQAIESLRTELPKLIGPIWPAFSKKLAKLTADLSAGPPRDAAARRELLKLFAQHPAAKERLEKAIRDASRRAAPPKKASGRKNNRKGRSATSGELGPGLEGLELHEVTSFRHGRKSIKTGGKKAKSSPSVGGMKLGGSGGMTVTPESRPRTRSVRPSLEPLEERRVPSYSSGPFATNESFSFSLRDLEAVEDSSTGTVTRYTDIVCPRRVWINTSRIVVLVRLTVQIPTLSAAITQMELKPELPVRVQLEAPGFDMFGGNIRDIAIKADADSDPVVFELKPNREGTTQLTFGFFQAGDPVGTANVPVEITTVEVSENPEPITPRPIRSEKDLRPPDIVLHISYQPNPTTLTFTLIRDGGASWRTFVPVEISGQPEAAARELYGTIAKLVQRNDPVLKQQLNQLRAIPAGDVDRRIRQLGQNLWRNLIPEELRTLYSRERDKWKDRSLLVFSDEPHFPWELVWPYDENGVWRDESPWCITMRMTRWLRKDARGNGNDTPPGMLKLHDFAVLAPQYQVMANLAGAHQERDILLRLALGLHLNDASPKPEYEPVLDLLENGGYDWLHAAAHGSFHPETPDGDSALWLENDRSLTPDVIVGPEIEGYLRKHRPGFVFNACQTGRQDFALTRIGGWANRLLSSGAGLFVGPQWEVQDVGALKFAEAFYTALFAGDHVADAVRKARFAARSVGDPTWLAYSVFAHPNAVVSSRNGEQEASPGDLT